MFEIRRVFTHTSQNSTYALVSGCIRQPSGNETTFLATFYMDQKSGDSTCSASLGSIPDLSYEEKSGLESEIAVEVLGKVKSYFSGQEAELDKTVSIVDDLQDFAEMRSEYP